MENGALDADALIGKVVRFEIFYPSDLEGHATLISISPNAEEVFGYSLAAWERPHDQWLQMLYPGDYARAVSASWATARTFAPLSVECRMVRDDGSTLWILDEEAVEATDEGEIWRGTFTVIANPTAPGWTPAQMGSRILSDLGPVEAGDLLQALDGSAEDRAALIQRLRERGGTEWLVELLGDLEMDPAAGLRVAEGLRRAIRTG